MVEAGSLHSVYKVQTARLYHIAEAFLRTIREFE